VPRPGPEAGRRVLGYGRRARDRAVRDRLVTLRAETQTLDEALLWLNDRCGTDTHVEVRLELEGAA
jgi:hypothetical protein